MPADADEDEWQPSPNCILSLVRSCCCRRRRGHDIFIKGGMPSEQRSVMKPQGFFFRSFRVFYKVLLPKFLIKFIEDVGA